MEYVLAYVLWILTLDPESHRAQNPAAKAYQPSLGCPFAVTFQEGWDSRAFGVLFDSLWEFGDVGWRNDIRYASRLWALSTPLTILAMKVVI